MQKKILAFGAHPDDVEWGMAGTLLKMKKAGCELFIVDLTQGEAAATGTPDERYVETENAAALLGARRLVLNLGDKKLQVDNATSAIVLDIIKQIQPDLVYAPYWEDSHPDHAVAGELLMPYASAFYIIRGSVQPTHAVDITEEINEKKKILWQHESQVRGRWEKKFWKKHSAWGKQLNVKFAEGFVVNDKIDFLKEEMPELL